MVSKKEKAEKQGTVDLTQSNKAKAQTPASVAGPKSGESKPGKSGTNKKGKAETKPRTPPKPPKLKIENKSVAAAMRLARTALRAYPESRKKIDGIAAQFLENKLKEQDTIVALNELVQSVHAS
jgi:hypothetical protein